MRKSNDLPPYLIEGQACTRAMRALVPGSFDPVTVGHMNIIRRASEMFDHVTAAVLVNAQKQYLLTLSEKTLLLECACKDLGNVHVTHDEGMLYEFCQKNGIDVIVKGVRNEADYAYECQMASYNYEHAGVRTLLLEADPALEQVSSTLVKQGLSSCETVLQWLPEGAKEPFLNMLQQRL